LLAIGASSVAQATIAHWRRLGWAPERGPDAAVKPATGPVFVLVGSQSPVSAKQTAAALRDTSLYEPISLDPQSGGGLDFEQQAATCARLLGAGRSVLAYLGPVVNGGPSRLEVAQACGKLLRRVLELTPVVRKHSASGRSASSACSAPA
jgi:hypothetical protein